MRWNALLNRETAISFIIAAGLGAAIWGLSPAVTGAAEPWDAESAYYSVALFVSGAIVGLLRPYPVWPAFFGIVVGQAVYVVLFLPSGPLLPLGGLFLLVYGVLSLIGAAVASRIRRWLKSTGAGDNCGS